MRQTDSEVGSPALDALNINAAAVGFDDVVGDMQPQARADLLGGEKRIENVGQVLFRRSHSLFSINDHPEMRTVFKGFAISPVSLTYSAAQAKCTKGRELIISNFKL